MSDTFPRQYARTQRLTLGDPRTITVSADGERVVFARSRSGEILGSMLNTLHNLHYYQSIMREMRGAIETGASR